MYCQIEYQIIDLCKHLIPVGSVEFITEFYKKVHII